MNKYVCNMAPQAESLCIRLETLRRTPVSKSKYLSCEPNYNLKTPNIVPWPESRPEFPGDADDGSAPTTLQSGQTPIP